MNKQTGKNNSTGERVAFFVFVVTIALYFINILIGKASLHWGWDIFYLGSVSEFLLILVSSIAFIVVALYREAVAENNNQ